MKLEVIKTYDGDRYVRPAGELGTCGWHPKAWQIARIKSAQTPLSAFLAANKLWSEGDIE